MPIAAVKRRGILDAASNTTPGIRSKSMSTTPDSVLTVICPGCQKRLRLPASAAGKNGQCPVCKTNFKVPGAQPEPVVVKPQLEEPSRFRDEDFYDLAPSPSPPSSSATATFPDLAKEPPLKLQYPKPEKYDAFRHEKRGIERGVLGGLAMIAIAAIWFYVGWQCGRVFFYPPILFVIGVFAVIKGLVTGNFAGGMKKAGT
jgi:hypothetical protein